MFLPVEVSTAENEGVVEICAGLAVTPANAVTGNDVTITLATDDSSGKGSKVTP